MVAKMSVFLARTGFVFLAAIAIWVLVEPPGGLHSQSPNSTAFDEQSGDLRVVSSMLPNGTQQIVVVEGSGRTMAVYHIEPAQGKIQLKSVRKLAWDLRMEQFNGQAPLPSELKLVQP